MNPVLPHSVFLWPISLSVIISRHVWLSWSEEALKTDEDSLIRSWPINSARGISVAMTAAAETFVKRRNGCRVLQSTEVPTRMIL